jgi:hypothetical protein
MNHISHEAVAQVAALALVIGGAIFLALAARSRLVRSGSVASRVRASSVGAGTVGAGPADGAAPSVGRSITIILAALSGGAAVIHLAAAPHHYPEIGDLASGFVVAAIFQGAWIRWCLAGPGRGAVLIGIVGNLAIVAAWAWTRTVGLPLAGVAGAPEPVAYPDAASVAFELLLVGGLVLRELARRRSAVIRGGPVGPGLRTAASIAVVPVVGLVLVLTSLGTVAIASGFEHGRSPDGGAMMEHVAAP